MKQVELAEEEMTDLRMGAAEGRLLGPRNTSILFEGQQQSTSPRWSPLRWSREAEGRLRGEEEEEEEEEGEGRIEDRFAPSRVRGDENLSNSGIVWLEVSTSILQRNIYNIFETSSNNQMRLRIRRFTIFSRFASFTSLELVVLPCIAQFSKRKIAVLFVSR